MLNSNKDISFATQNISYIGTKEDLDMGGNNKFIDKFSNVAMRVGGQIHLKALRDTFATIMPLYILAGVAVLINNVVLPFILK